MSTSRAKAGTPSPIQANQCHLGSCEHFSVAQSEAPTASAAASRPCSNASHPRRTLRDRCATTLVNIRTIARQLRYNTRPVQGVRMLRRTPEQIAVDTAIKNGALPPDAVPGVWGPLLVQRRRELVRMRRIYLFVAAAVWFLVVAGAAVSAAEESGSPTTYLFAAVAMVSTAALPIAFHSQLRKLDRLESGQRPTTEPTA